MSDRVAIRRAVLDELVAHARDEAPRECCGLLVGTAARIDASRRTRNVADGPTRYQVDPREHIALTRELRGSGTSVVGAYHSHVNTAAVPSPTDVAEAYYPDFVYVIVSLAAGEDSPIAGYRIEQGSYRAIELVVVQ